MKKKELIPVINVDQEKCVNCHVCINACPVKYCNDGSGDFVKVNHNLCIACGSCLSACTHEARQYIDDFDIFIENLKNGEKIVAIAAPSVASNFPDQYLKLNGWLKNIGVEAVFDVSFGAELTTASYIDHIKKNSPQIVIAQPCAAIVTFIEVFKPELIKHLAPVDSPMLHTIKLIKNYYPEYKNHKIAVISPCLAKKREFVSTGLGDYNVSYLSLQKYFTENSISLADFSDVDYDNPPAERAVLFSTPGGLLQTAERWIPGIRNKTRKIEGVHTIYDYLETLPKMILEKKSPFLVDCLNCEKGCNGGSLTIGKDKPVDEIEALINERNEEMQKLYAEKSLTEKTDLKTHIEKLLEKYWKPELYDRKYDDNSANNTFKTPTESELQEIYHKMHKYSESDFYNCSSCGYGKCEKMAFAIFNELNRPENCHFYLSKEGEIAHNATELSQKRLQTILNTMVEGFVQVDNDGKITHHNPALTKILKTEDIIDKKLSDFFDVQNKKIFDENLKLREQHIQSSYEIAFTCADGSTAYCIVNGCPFYDENGKKTGSFGIITNITLRKIAENELQKSRDELEIRVQERTAELTEIVEELRVSQEVIEEYNKELKNLSIVASNTSNGVLILSANAKIEWFNNGYSNMFGYTNEEFSKNLNKNFIEIVDENPAKEALQNCIETKETVIYEASGTTKNLKGIWTQVALTPILDEQNEIIKLVIVVSNITDLKYAEEEIHVQNEEIMSQRDAIEQRADELSEALDQLKLSQAKIIESEKMVALGQLIAGVAHEINTPLGAIRSSVGNISNTLNQILTKLSDFFRAITEEEKVNFFELLDKSLKTNNNLTSKEERAIKREIIEFLENQNVETPENVADTLVDMCIYNEVDKFLILLKSKQCDEIIQMAYKLSGLLRSSQTITTAIDRASKVVFALKNFAHYDNSGEMIKSNIINSIETVLTLYHNQLKQGINVIRNFEEIPEIMCFPDELNQVWTNLVHNAIQAMDNKGDLTIDVYEKNAKIFVSFTDIGKGIPEEIQDKIFKPFFTTKAQGEGSGLGLDIVRRIIEKHKGEITFVSEPGKTTFTVSLNI